MPENPVPSQPDAEPVPVTEPVPVSVDNDDRVTQGLLWGLGGAIATLVILTAILAVVNKTSRRH